MYIECKSGGTRWPRPYYSVGARAEELEMAKDASKLLEEIG